MVDVFLTDKQGKAVGLYKEPHLHHRSLRCLYQIILKCISCNTIVLNISSKKRIRVIGRRLPEDWLGLESLSSLGQDTFCPSVNEFSVLPPTCPLLGTLSAGDEENWMRERK